MLEDPDLLALSHARSYLFVPGTRPDRFAKALACGAHAVIVDLEDAVAPHDKDSARDKVAAWFEQNSDCQVMLRINPCGSRWHRDDLQLATAPNVSALVIPKAEHAEEFPQTAGKPLLPIIETALGFSLVDSIAAHPGAARLIFGTYDFRVDLGLGESAESLLFFASRLVLASRLAGLAPPVDGVMANLRDDNGWLAEARRARELGFGGKLCIHPRQVDAVNQGFAPTEVEVRWAQRILTAAGDQATAVVDGEFVDRPILLHARAIIEQAARIK